MRHTIVAEARKWVGTKFRHQGRCKQGVDCAGLLYVVYNATIGVGLLKNFNNYSSQPETGYVFRAIKQYANRISQAQAQAGDVVLLNFAGSSTHFGILTGTGVVHADSDLKKVVEHSLPVGNGRAVAFFRMRGM